MKAERARHDHGAPAAAPVPAVPDDTGHFGPYGGRFVPETLIAALDELEAEYARARSDPAFQGELETLLRDFAQDDYLSQA